MKKISAIILISCALVPIIASAYNLLQPLPGIGQGGGGSQLTVYLTWLYRFALAAAAFLALLHIVIGGIMIMVGGASEASQSKGREMIKNAIWGLLLAITAWLILWTINPDLVEKGFKVDPVTIKGSSSANVNTGGGGSSAGPNPQTRIMITQ